MIPVRKLINALLDSDQECDELLRIATDCHVVVLEQKDMLARKDAEIASLRLEHARNIRDLLEKFLVCHEHPEIDVREPILLCLRDLYDEIARMEEHSPS